MIFSTFERMVALRYLRARRQEGFISVTAWFSLLGIALGVATLIIVMAVMNGFRQELLGRIIGLNGHLEVVAGADGIAGYDGIAGTIRKIPGVVAVAPMVQGQVMATANHQATGALVRGLRADAVRERPTLVKGIRDGSLDDFKGIDAIMVGTRLAQRLGTAIGGAVTLIAPQATITAFGSMPRSKTYRVVAIFEVGMYEYDSGYVYMPLEAAQLLFQMETRVNNLDIVLTGPEAVDAVRPPVQAAIGETRLYDWRQANRAFFNAVQVERNVMFLILTLIVLVAAFNIISSLIMLVKDKGKAIAVMRTMGATRGAVMRIFVLAGSLIGIVGTLTGFALGLSFAANIETIRQWLQSLSGVELFAAEIYFLTQLPAKVDPVEVAEVVAMALALSLLATIYPAWRAARLDPVEALRYE